jgi:nicotinate-nucleotide adenylyltransferase
MNRLRMFGIFGGLFDPPHIAHLIIAQTVLEEFHLNHMVFVPAGNPPHKKAYSTYSLRHHMAKLAIKHNARFSVSDIEKKMKGKTYTIDVVRTLQQELKGQLNLVIGADQWAEINTWKTPDEIIKICRIIVIPRPGYRIRVTERFTDKVIVSKAPLLDISSTMIRRRVKKGLDITYYVLPDVHAYIQRKKLYR